LAQTTEGISHTAQYSLEVPEVSLSRQRQL